MSAHHVRVAAAAVAVLVVVPPAVVLSASAGTAAATAVYSRFAPWFRDASDSAIAVASRALLLTPASTGVVRWPPEPARRNAAELAIAAPATSAVVAASAPALASPDTAAPGPAYARRSGAPHPPYPVNPVATREGALVAPETPAPLWPRRALPAPQPKAESPLPGSVLGELAAVSPHALSADIGAAEQPATTPRFAPSPSNEQPPFALALLVTNSQSVASTVSQVVSPLTYPDRAQCEGAGQQWALEAKLSGPLLMHVTPICVPQVADVPARTARLWDNLFGTGQSR